MQKQKQFLVDRYLYMCKNICIRITFILYWLMANGNKNVVSSIRITISNNSKNGTEFIVQSNLDGFCLFLWFFWPFSNWFCWQAFCFWLDFAFYVSIICFFVFIYNLHIFGNGGMYGWALHSITKIREVFFWSENVFVKNKQQQGMFMCFNFN